jgi:hypothetical protein
VGVANCGVMVMKNEFTFFHVLIIANLAIANYWLGSIEYYTGKLFEKVTSVTVTKTVEEK